jgi:hypothetical protein
MVVVEAARLGLLETMLRGRRIAMAASACRQVRYWRDELGVRHGIDLEALIRSGLIVRVEATVAEMDALLRRMSGRTLGMGELESLAIVVSLGARFCTAEDATVRVMAMLGIGDQWVPIRKLSTDGKKTADVPETKCWPK